MSTRNAPMSVLVCLPDGDDLRDPDPAATQGRDVRLVSDWADDTAGVVGWSTGGWAALEAAVAHSDLPRLVLVNLPWPDDLPEGLDVQAVRAKTLLLFGAADPTTGARHGSSWQRALPDARLEMVPNGGHDLLGPMWGRILSHLAPRRRRS